MPTPSSLRSSRRPSRVSRSLKVMVEPAPSSSSPWAKESLTYTYSIIEGDALSDKSRRSPTRSRSRHPPMGDQSARTRASTTQSGRSPSWRIRSRLAKRRPLPCSRLWKQTSLPTPMRRLS
ncbi:hypothetical protein CDL15_Pgr011306 [Punica granatum]|uniref:Uncharacterized protein n=1 Tax=Punica granatum TaxID=22663 RepID=A0A218WFA5_PUNGR|nr:hypothetical protein CDL15_Pgr011306 [Punica granatum]